MKALYLFGTLYCVMKIYFSSSRKNRGINEQVIDVLSSVGEVYYIGYAQPSENSHRKMFGENMRNLRESDVVVALLKNVSSNVATELGIAYGMGKPIVYIDFGERVGMLGMLSEEKVPFSELEKIGEVLKRYC